jgi:hypothetical protein
MTSSAIDKAFEELKSFYVSTYHIADALKDAGVIKKVSDIDTDPRLRLLADVANLAKHRTLDGKPHSGAKPAFGRREGMTIEGGGWQLRLRIEHRDRYLDGLQFARDAVEGWRRFLSTRGLI